MSIYTYEYMHIHIHTHTYSILSHMKYKKYIVHLMFQKYKHINIQCYQIASVHSCKIWVNSLKYK